MVYDTIVIGSGIGGLAWYRDRSVMKAASSVVWEYSHMSHCDARSDLNGCRHLQTVVTIKEGERQNRTDRLAKITKGAILREFELGPGYSCLSPFHVDSDEIPLAILEYVTLPGLRERQ